MAKPPAPPPASWIRVKLVRSRFGWYAHITHGPAKVGEAPAFAFTRRGIQRKVDRITAGLRRGEERWAAAEEHLL